MDKHLGIDVMTEWPNIEITERRDCGCIDYGRSGIQACRVHWNRMQVKWEIDAWTSWGYPDYRNPWESHTAKIWSFWFMRASF